MEINRLIFLGWSRRPRKGIDVDRKALEGRGCKEGTGVDRRVDM